MKVTDRELGQGGQPDSLSRNDSRVHYKYILKKILQSSFLTLVPLLSKCSQMRRKLQNFFFLPNCVAASFLRLKKLRVTDTNLGHLNIGSMRTLLLAVTVIGYKYPKYFSPSPND